MIANDNYEMFASDYPIDAVQDENGCWVDDVIVHMVKCKKNVEHLFIAIVIPITAKVI